MPTYVGIGTTVEHGMEVVGDAIIEGQEGGPLSTRVPFELFSNVSGNSTIADSRQMRLRVQPSNEISPDDSYVVDMGIQNTTDNFFFITAPQNTSITGTQRSFVITKTSNVGVGTAEPLEKFHVQGDVKANVINAYRITGTPNLDMMGTFANVTATSNVVISGTNSTLSATADIATNAVNTVMTSTGDLSTNSVNTTLSSTGDLSTNSVNTTLSSTGDLSTNSVNTTLSSTGDLSTNSVNTTLSSTGDLSTNSVNTTLSSTGDTTASSVNTTLTTTGDITAKSVNTTLTSTGILDMRAPSILATGNVGVGTATPLDKLHVFGDIRSNALTTSTVTGLTALDLVANTDLTASSVNTTLTTTGDITAKSVNTTLTSTGILDMRAPSILATGNVGVGTATPLEKLHVFGNIRSNALTTSTVTGLTDLDLVATSNTNISSVNTIVTSSANTFVSGDNIILNTSNVGIGTATPMATLHVQGDFKATGNVEIGVVSYNKVLGAGPIFTITTTDIMLLGSTAVGTTGTVGVGTTVPETTLQVLGDVAIGKSGENAGPHTLFFGGLVNDANLAETVVENRTYDGGNGTELLLFKGNNADASNGYDRIRLRAGRIVLDTFPATTADRTIENPRVTILQDGKVGIGTTDPEYRLDVVGTTRFDGGAMYFGTTEGLNSITTLRVTIGTQGGFGGTKQVQATWPNSYSSSTRLMVQVTIDIDGTTNDDDDTFMTTVTGVNTTGCKINVRKFNGGTWSTTLYAMVTVFELSAAP